MTFLNFTLVADFVLMVLSIYLVWRNEQVFKFRNWTNHQIYELARYKGMAWHTHMRREEQRITYGNMMVRFWKPLHKFYDQNFIKELEEQK